MDGEVMNQVNKLCGQYGEIINKFKEEFISTLQDYRDVSQQYANLVTEHLKYQEAEREGRLLVLPVKPGSTVYVTVNGNHYYKATLLGYGAYGDNPEYKTYCVNVHKSNGHSFVDYFKEIHLEIPEEFYWSFIKD